MSDPRKVTRTPRNSAGRACQWNTHRLYDAGLKYQWLSLSSLTSHFGVILTFTLSVFFLTVLLSENIYEHQPILRPKK